MLFIPLTPRSVLHVLLHRLLHGNWRDKGRVIIKTKNAILYGRSSDLVAMSLIEEPKTCKLILQLCKSPPTGTFLDLGAHVGSYTVAVAKQGWRVTALEPAPDTFNYLKQNVFVNRLENVQLMNVALWSSNGFAWLYNSPNQDGDSSLVENTTGPRVQVRTKTLTALLDEIGHVNVAKMDIEGAEINVLSNSNSLSCVDNWIIETSTEEAPHLMLIMKEKGYSCRTIEHLVRGGNIINVFFYRNKPLTNTNT
jgi:FkbM family methyltransferase